jgi:hypothetical protein
MNRLWLSAVAAVCLVDAGGNLQAQRAPTGASFVPSQLSFKPGEDPAHFFGQGPGYSVRIAPSQANFQFEMSRGITLDLLNANSGAHLSGETLLPGKASYFPGPDKSTWRTGVSRYAQIRDSEVYPGVDLTFYGNQHRLECDFLLKSQADPRQIQLTLSGSDRVSINEAGDLVATVDGKQFRLQKPVAYQRVNDSNERELVGVSYRLNQTDSGKSALVTFSLGAYDHTRPLVIDPVLSYSEYLDSYPQAVAVDPSGNTYVTTGYYGSAVGFHLTKYSPTGALIYDVKLGDGDLVAYSIAVDSTGRVYLAGQAGSNATLPTSTNSYSTTVPNYSGAFFMQVAADGGSVPYAT